MGCTRRQINPSANPRMLSRLQAVPSLPLPKHPKRPPKPAKAWNPRKPIVYDLAEFQCRLNYRFRNPALLKMALTHPSISTEVSGEPYNQRLEFLGDAVLQLALTHELYQRFPEFGEGPMTKARAQWVIRKSL